MAVNQPLVLEDVLLRHKKLRIVVACGLAVSRLSAGAVVCAPQRDRRCWSAVSGVHGASGQLLPVWRGLTTTTSRVRVVETRPDRVARVVTPVAGINDLHIRS